MHVCQGSAFQLGFLPSKPDVFFRECSFEFMLHRKKNSQLTWRFSREQKKNIYIYINMLAKRI